MRTITRPFIATLLLACLPLLVPVAALAAADDLDLQARYTQAAADQVTDNIWMAQGFGNTFLVTTPAGNVVIDTSLEAQAPRHHQLLTAVSDAPIHSIIITHGHGDHTGGIPLWRGPETRVLAQEEAVEFRAYQQRIGRFFNQRNRAQFGFELADADEGIQQPSDYTVDPSVQLFDKAYNFTLGGEEFVLQHIPAETYDALLVWLPGQKAVFVGDLFYRSFPNMYTLRGTKPRWALDYINSLDQVLALQPEILLPSHGAPIKGAAAVAAALRKYRDAIRYVHDATVAGMNAGKDVFTLMEEIRLPAALDIGEGYGRIAWSVRGIYEGYAGWFNGNPSSMYSLAPADIETPLVAMAGGPAAVAARAQQEASAGNLPLALRLTDAALAAEPHNHKTLEVRLDILQRMRAASDNNNEKGWLKYGIQTTRQAMEH